MGAGGTPGGPPTGTPGGPSSGFVGTPGGPPGYGGTPGGPPGYGTPGGGTPGGPPGSMGITSVRVGTPGGPGMEDPNQSMHNESIVQRQDGSTYHISNNLDPEE